MTRKAALRRKRISGRFHYEDRSAPFEYRYLIDIDGNAYANRFYRLLGSDSVPLKITIFKEWHDDRLIPWLHYIPVSQSMEEIPELTRFLISNRVGTEDQPGSSKGRPGLERPGSKCGTTRGLSLPIDARTSLASRRIPSPDPVVLDGRYSLGRKRL